MRSNLSWLQYSPSNLCCVQTWPSTSCWLVKGPTKLTFLFQHWPTNFRCLQYLHIRLILFSVGTQKTYTFTVLTYTLTLLTVWTHQTYVFHCMEPLNLRWLQHRPIKLTFLQHGYIKPTLFTIWTYRFYVVYGMDPSKINCSQNEHTKLKLFTVRIHQTYIVNGIDPSNVNGLQYGDIERMLLTVWKYVDMINPVNLRCWQNGPIHPFLQPDTHKPDTTLQVSLSQLLEQFCLHSCPYVPSTQATIK